MTWVLVEVVPFLLGAFALGILSGFAMWRWRRQSIKASDWNKLTSATHRARVELELLEQQHRSLTDDRNSLANRIDELDSEMAAIRQDLRSANKQSSQYRAQRESALSRLESVTGELTRMRERLVAAEANMSHARERIAELVIFETESRQLKEELDVRNSRLTSMERKLVHSETQSEQLTAHLTGLQTTLSAVRADLDRETHEAERLRAAVADAEQRLQELEPLAARVPALEGALESTRTELDKSQARVAELDALLSSTRFEREAALTRLAELDNDIRDAGDQQTHLRMLQSRVADLTAELARRDASIAELREALGGSHALRDELDAAQTKVAEISASLDQRASENDALRAELELAGRQLSDHAEGAADRNALRERINAATSRIRVLDRELAERSKVARQARADLVASHRRLAELELELAETTSTLLTYTDPIDEAPTLQAELDAAREHIAKLEAELDEADGRSDAQELSAELGQLRVELAERNRRVEALESAHVIDLTADRAPIPEPGPQSELAVGRGGASHHDDLTIIVGIGSKIEELLNAHGITRWDQLANLDESGMQELVDGIDVPGEVDVESWMSQADQLIRRYPDAESRPDRRTYRSTTHKLNQRKQILLPFE